MQDFATRQLAYWEAKKHASRRSPFHPVVKAYVLPRIEEIRRSVPLNPGTRLLDVGCGNGFFLAQFAGICRTTGIDSSASMLAMNPVPGTRLMQAEKMDFPDNSFDVAFCHALLHHTEDPGRVVAEMKRVSSRYVVILEPNRNNPLMFLFALLLRAERKALEFSATYVRHLAEEQQLKIIDIFAYGAIVPNKVPLFLLSFLHRFNLRGRMGVTIILIAEKNGSPGEKYI